MVMSVFAIPVCLARSSITFVFASPACAFAWVYIMYPSSDSSTFSALEFGETLIVTNTLFV